MITLEMMPPLMFCGLIVTLLLGFPVAFSLGAVGIAFGLLGIELGLLDTSLLQALPERVFGVMSNDTLLAVPLQLAAETLAVTAIEVKLVAELHELFGTPATGQRTARSAAYLMSWARQRAVDPIVTGGLGAVLGQAAKRELRGRIIRRLGRSATSLAPFLAGAVAGSEVNRRATRALGEKLTAELRERQHPRGTTGQ